MTYNHATAELVHIEVADVDRPELMTIPRPKRHRFLLMRPLGGAAEVIQFAVEPKHPSDGCWTQLDSHPPQCGVNSPRSDAWISTEAANFTHGTEVDFTMRTMWST